MQWGRTILTGTLAVALAACGGGDSNSSGGGIISGGGGGGGGTGTDACSLSERQDWSLAVLDEWYLFPDLLDTSVNKADYSTVQDYLNAIVAPARAQDRDRFFTYITSKSEEEALISSGSSAGFGIRLAYDTTNNQVFVLEAFESAPAFGAGMDRGTEILAIGDSSTTLQAVSALMASGGPQAVIDALGPSDPGVTRVLQFRTATGTQLEQSIAKADYSLDPISDRYGVRIIDDGGKKVGYLNLRTFIISDASDQLRDAFSQFRAEGVTELIIDFRYNGGGLINVAETFGDLLGSANVGQVFSQTEWRPSKSDRNTTSLFRQEANAIAPTKIAFIGRSGTASASELVMNSMTPYLGNNLALVGTNTFGKPVGQSGFDLDACDDRLRVVTLKTNNANGEGEYFNGLATTFPNTCAANDDIFTALGDPSETSIASALDFLAGRTCTPIASSKEKRTAQSVGPVRELMMPAQPGAAQHWIPGIF